MIIRKSLVRMKSMHLMLLKSNTPAWFDHHAHVCVIIQRIRPVDEETYKISLKVEEKKIPYRIHIYPCCHHRYLTSFFPITSS
jgi:hypothetical protein